MAVIQKYSIPGYPFLEPFYWFDGWLYTGINGVAQDRGYGTTSGGFYTDSSFTELDAGGYT